jgi:hypothetical protein
VDFYAGKNLTASAGFEPAILGIRGQRIAIKNGWEETNSALTVEHQQWQWMNAK